MAVTDPGGGDKPVVSNKEIALLVYILYFCGFLFAITPLIGVIVAHVQRSDADPLLQSHYTFQIRTFWIGVLYLVAGAVLSLILVGVAILVWWMIWTIVRCVKGVIALNENRPIADPQSWLFG